MLSFKVSLLSDEFLAEPRLVLYLGTEARSLGSVIEVCSCNGASVGIESRIAPNRTPESGTLDRNHVNTALKHIYRKFGIC